MALSTYSLWELFPIGRSTANRNPHFRKAGPGRRRRTSRARSRARVPALGIGDWKGQRYLSYHAHDAQRAWRGQHPPGVAGPGEYLRRACGIDTQWMDEADIHLRFWGIMKKLGQLFG